MNKYLKFLREIEKLKTIERSNRTSRLDRGESDAQQMKLGKYQHSKTGNFYRVIGIARHSETLEELVVYEALYANPKRKLWLTKI